MRLIARITTKAPLESRPGEKNMKNMYSSDKNEDLPSLLSTLAHLKLAHQEKAQTGFLQVHKQLQVAFFVQMLDLKFEHTIGGQ